MLEVPTRPTVSILADKAREKFRTIPIMTRAQLHAIMVVPSPVVGDILRELVQRGEIKSILRPLGSSLRSSRLYFLAEAEDRLATAGYV